MTAKRMSAADLRRNLAGFEKSMRDRLAETEQALVDWTTESLRSYYEGRQAAYQNSLVALHIYTDGEFGEAPPTQDGVQ